MNNKPMMFYAAVNTGTFDISDEAFGTPDEALELVAQDTNDYDSVIAWIYHAVNDDGSLGPVIRIPQEQLEAAVG